MKLATDNRDFGFDPREFNIDPVAVAYREALGDGLERVLDAGAETLADVVKGLNDVNVSAPGGAAWVEDTLVAELSRLAQ